jgi:hypothetical protein
MIVRGLGISVIAKRSYDFLSIFGRKLFGFGDYSALVLHVLARRFMCEYPANSLSGLA